MMKKRIMTIMQIESFKMYLHTEERSQETMTKYLRDVRAFYRWLEERPVTKDLVAAWKEHLQQLGKAAVTVNGALAAVHSFFAMLGWNECRVRYLKIQRPVFRNASRELSREEFVRLVHAAQRTGNERLAVLLEAICSTGIRASEVRYLTVEAVRKGRADISLKGKIRTILIPDKLAKKLMKYAKKEKIAAGAIFVTASGRGISRTQIWHEMKKLCNVAEVDAEKVFPHNLRHLFARSYYKVCKDIVQLADVLGHSSIQTTRIYLMTTGAEHARQLNLLGLVS